MTVKSLINVAVISALIILTASCSTKQGLIKTKESLYELNIKKTSLNHNPVISGYVYEFGTKSPVLGASVWNHKHYNNNTKVDISGKFIYSIKPGKYRILASFVGFRPCKTNSITVSKGDTIEIDFYLKPDTSNFPDPVIKTKRRSKK
ncbi:carboxypeptidase-like regulatory domain-containing protein [Pedobacter sp. UYP1]|jgi:hypothetical protein|uniref:carboxypeptidase-like regulatory domain-containing protein n=1 Tax=Pedobacter sp. UYP1 TaxID=1756396 RepID=UPI003398194E